MSDLMIATAATSIRVPPGRIKVIDIGDVVDRDIWQHMTDEHRSLTLTVYDPEAQLAPDEYEPGTSDDPRLDGAPNTNAKIAQILDWIGDDTDRAAAVYERELRRTQARPTLMAELAAILDS